jgi:hypothetical protein
MRVIRVGDTVTYRPRGNSAHRTAKVLSIEICRAGTKYGREVRTCDLDKHSEVALDLDDHHWIFKSQIIEINKGE